jgi:ribosomal protein S4
MNGFDLKKFKFEGEVKVFAKHQLAKRITRKYHGQGLTERIFKTQLYSPQFNVVAGGHKDGKRLIWGGLFRGVERRLDIVIFRSLFASSIQQARQLVVHGHVEVNGKIVFQLWIYSLTERNVGPDCY